MRHDVQLEAFIVIQARDKSSLNWESRFGEGEK